jgi:N-acetylglucosamine-6-sulfatase
MRKLAFILSLAFVTPATAKPNFVVILTDDQEDTGSMAYMPKVHALLAEKGITFTNSFVTFPICAPSRVSLLTGQYAHNHGVKSDSPTREGGWQRFKEKEVNQLPVWLETAGYRTAFMGKYLNGYGGGAEVGAPPSWVPPGWDYWFAFTGPPTYYDYKMNENGTLVSFDHEESDYSTDVLRDRAVHFLEQQAGTSQPFFLLVAPKAPHAQAADGERKPALPAPRHQHRFADINLPPNPSFNEHDVSDKPKWVQMSPEVSESTKQDLTDRYRSELQALQSVDDLVDAVVRTLESIGKLDDTVIIFTSDNGYLFGDHRQQAKFNAYEGSIRVPLVMRGPQIPQNELRDQLVDNLNVVASIEEFAGVTPGVPPDGRSLVPLLKDAKAPWRSAVLIEGGDEGAPPSRRFKTIRTATRKYTKYEDGFEELYDLTIDPAELENRAGDPRYATDKAELRDIYNRLKSCAGDACSVKSGG